MDFWQQRNKNNNLFMKSKAQSHSVHILITIAPQPIQPRVFVSARNKKLLRTPNDHKLIKNRNKRERNWKLDGEFPAAKLVRWKFVKTRNHLRLNASRSFKWFTIFVYTCSQMQLIHSHERFKNIYLSDASRLFAFRLLQLIFICQI